MTIVVAKQKFHNSTVSHDLIISTGIEMSSSKYGTTIAKYKKYFESSTLLCPFIKKQLLNLCDVTKHSDLNFLCACM